MKNFNEVKTKLIDKHTGHIYDNFELLVEDGLMTHVKYFDIDEEEVVSCHISYFNIITETSGEG